MIKKLVLSYLSTLTLFYDVIPDFNHFVVVVNVAFYYIVEIRLQTPDDLTSFYHKLIKNLFRSKVVDSQKLISLIMIVLDTCKND